jgi:alpha-tubulin suppressor-like RCC1 family protein
MSPALHPGLSTGRRATLIGAVAGALLFASSGAAFGSGAKPASLPKISSVKATSGPTTGGTKLTVKGTNLNHVLSVTFGGIQGTAVHVSASHTSLQVTTPASAPGAVDVRVKTTAGTSGLSSKDLYTYRTYSTLTTGWDHTCDVVAGGAVHCWGAGAVGQLGNNTTANTSTPVSVSGLVHVVEVSSTQDHTCALINDGTVRCWGVNASGQLGNHTTTTSPVPVKVQGLNHVVAISAGYISTCALIADRTVRCWGDNALGELGNGTTTSSLSPVKVSGLTHVVGISGGGSFSCALRSDGKVRCWGGNGAGELGNGTTTNSSTPVEVSGVSHARELSAGATRACAVVSGGAVRCWGENSAGELGNGTTTSSLTSTPVAGLVGVTILSLGFFDSCAAASGHVFCWGSNAQGEVGDGSTTSPRLTPSAVARLGLVRELSVGGAHVCVRRTGGSLRCWGYNFYGELGNGTTVDSSFPVPVSG